FGKNVNQELEYTKIFFEIANKNQLDVDSFRVDSPFHAPFRTVSNYIHRHCKISTLEIEINSQFFKNQEQTLLLLKTLDEYATYIEKNLNKNESNNLSL
ncbi:MAG: hypothetical protein J5779_00915, partial [Clostridia bacterium]|nr:hypothetical protein [Clostridia bacterium]